MLTAAHTYIKNEYKVATILQSLFSSGALLCVLIFAIWWFNPYHIPHNFIGILGFIDLFLFLAVSYIIWHPLIMEVLTWTIASHIKPIRKQKPVPGMKVAFITTIVPKNEPIDLLHHCLPAMIKARYQHDTWLLDEGNNEEVKKICRQYGVYHFSRFGNERLNTKTGKYTKTKGGNHNSWYDTYGDYYDIVAQIDTDFVPKRDFLTKTLGYFRDPKVAFVGTPQIYGNTKNSLVAKGAAEQQYNFYGAVLRGLSGMGMTLLIGANHVVRVSAFKKVGHYTAHITEDLVTGMKLHANGYKSVYVPYPLAVGEGPATWESYFNQQLRWAYGCMDILFRHSPTYFKYMNIRQTLYYFFLQQHYFSGLVMALSIFLLCLYFMFGWRSANVDTFQFILFYSIILVISWLVSVWLQRFNVEKGRVGELQLAGKVISIAAWPIWFIAFINVLTGRRLTYKVTPKGENDNVAQSSRAVFMPHFFFAGFALIGLFLSTITHARSAIMLVWAVSSIVLMLIVPFVDQIVSLFTSVSMRLRGHVSLPRKMLVAKYGLVSDVLFLTFVVVLSFATYINRIGFYSDDWSFLGNFTLAKNHSLIGLIQAATTPNTFMRPMQNVYDALLFYLFGTNALGYQLVNAGVFLAIILLLYLILRILRVRRIISIAIPLVFSLLPNYSTDRFWFASFQVNLSILFFLISTLAGLKAFSQTAKKTFVWECISLLSLMLCLLSYEVVLPLIIVNMFLFWTTAHRVQGNMRKLHMKNPTIFITVNVIALLYLVIFKVKTTVRLSPVDYSQAIMHIFPSIIHTNFWLLGVKMPFILGDILTRYNYLPVLILSGILFLVVLVYMHLTFSDIAKPLPTTASMRNLIGAGILLFVLGYALFFTNNIIGFSPTGVDNRVAIAASLGIAFITVGIIGFLSRFVPKHFATSVFSTGIALVATGGFLVISTLATFWSSAYQVDQSVLADIKTNFPSMPDNSTLILDGVCPYVGPGIVFESQWDLKGALQTMYHEPSLQADIVTPRLKVRNTGISTQIYTLKSAYPYRNLFIYNYKNKLIAPIHNRQEAIAYFQKYNPDYNNGCPPAIAGNGVSIFN